MKKVTDSTPTEPGTYSVLGETTAACTPCCGNTDVYGKDEATVCRVCGKEFAISGVVEVATLPSYETAGKPGRRSRASEEDSA
jgi:hypothetical protein